MEKIKPINSGCNISRTDPLVFDDTITYLEELCLVIRKLNAVIINLDEVIEIVTNIDDNFDDIYNKINEIYGIIDTSINNLRTELTTYCNNEISNAITGLRAVVDLNYTTLNNKIDNAVIGQVDVYNPTNGLVENIDKVLNDIYNANRLYAITCEGYDDLELTASEYDSKQLTAYDFDNYSLELLS